ncbi:hypothetical protein [Plantactinospora endophytica]|uniref:HEAT repeat domain-containing protein n=1 Tax=Plantactinospora endophytica TaxID=673535 RepID=A0ABQ4E8T7_9ACTN|nr:hypothetical protein [Plantactinospora endophytica]GIG91140.1 hypothetical protein Pen02_60760 [Plantactinospora endophytica]
MSVDLSTATNRADHDDPAHRADSADRVDSADRADSADRVELPDLADRARAALARLDALSSESKVDPADRIGWAVARFDGGDHVGAAEDLTACLDGWIPREFAEAAPRILAGEQAVRFAVAALDGEHPYRSFKSGRSGPEDAVAGTLARLVAGDPDAEEALLRAVLMIRPDEDRRWAHLRAARISAVFAELAEAYVGEPDRLDRWSAALLAADDQPCLAAAAALFGPLGLAEVDRRCGTVREIDGTRLVAAFVAADRFDDALTLATRLEPSRQQRALLTLATPGLPPARAKALVAAFRKCPKGGRERDVQMIYQHRFARLFLALERVDDALAVLGRMRDCRVSGYGPGPLALEVLRWLDGRREAATSERLCAVLDVLVGPGVIPQELAAVVADVVPLAHGLADERMRAEIVDVHVPRLRARLRNTRSGLLVDAGLGAALVEAGDATALDPVFAQAANGRTDSRLSLVLARLAARAGLLARDRELFTRLVAGALSDGYWWFAEALLPTLDAETRPVVSDAVAAVPADNRRQVVVIARFAERAGDSALLAAMLGAAPDAESTWRVAGRVAMMLARHGQSSDALDLARRCGLVGAEPG